MNSKKLAAENYDYVVKLRRDFHQHPEPSMEEFRTTEKIAEQLDEIGIPYQRFEPTGLIGTIKGGSPGKTVALRADIDALSIKEKSGVEFASVNEGYMHACGHDTHAAMLLGASKALHSIRDELSGTVKVIFQPAEETALGAKKVIEQGALDGVDMIFAQHIFSQLPVGLIAVGNDATAAATDSFRITVNGTACHGATPQKGADALLAACAIVQNLQSIISREIDPEHSAVVTVGQLEAGSRFNIIAGSATMEGTVRTFDREIHAEMEERIRRIAQSTAEAYRCTAELEYSYITDVLVNDEHAVVYSKSAAEKAAAVPQLVIPAPRMMGGEDFAEYTKYVKSAFVGLGAGGEHPQHSDYFFVEEAAFPTGIAWLIQVAYDALAGKCE